MIGPRLAFSITLLLGGLFSPVAAEAQQAAKAARIGYLANLPPAAYPHLHEAFLQGLRDLGYVEGRNLVIEYRFAEGKFERFPALAAELVALRVDVIVAANSLAVLPAKQATKTIPIVFTVAADPVGSGLVTSLARPGGNVTGLSFLYPGASRQVAGTAHAGRSGGQSGSFALAARWLGRTHGKGHAEESRSRGTGARGTASIR
jgi:ABC-type uncharacterized transport system substrate-binding protein